MFLWLFGDLFENPDTFFKRIVNHLWLITYLVILNFILLEYAVPTIRLNWKRLLLIPIFIFVFLMLLSFGFYGWRNLGIVLNLYFELREHVSVMKGVEYHVPYSFASVLFFWVVVHLYDHNQLKQAAQKLKLEKQEAELNFLKSQTNPHFLFNTLNNIYSLARDKSDLAPESILRLSKILRFMLYETSAAFISVEQELKIINDYILLERLRYDESLRINLNHDVENLQQAIPPLLLMPLVENAFKHGVSESRREPFIDIHLSIKRRMLTFIVKNSSESSPGAAVKENIGLSNLRRQLQLLYSEYDLFVRQSEEVFTATLKINLASHV